MSDEIMQETPAAGATSIEAADDPQGEAATKQAAAAAEGAEQPAWMGTAISILTSLVVSMAAIGGYHFLAGGSATKPRIAVIDLGEVLQLKELEVTVMATKPNATDADRSRAWESMSKFAGSMDGALDEVQKECGCLVLVRSAVVKGFEEDLTGVLKKKMGVDHIDKEAMMRSLRAGPGAATGGTPETGGMGMSGMGGVPGIPQKGAN